MFDQLLEKYKWQITSLLIGLSFVAGGILLTSNVFQKTPSLEVLSEGQTQDQDGKTKQGKIYVDVGGAVVNPGVYELDSQSRVEDLLVKAGGLTSKANTTWVEKVLNRAQTLTDGQKIYIPSQDEVLSAKNETTTTSSQNSSSNSYNNQSNLININSATQKELESLSGIGPVSAQNIIDGRPYSSVEELLSKKILRSDIYEKNKDKLTVY